MGEMISKPDANPIIFAVCNFFLWGFLGYFLMGQKKKAIISVVIFWVLALCTMGAGNIIWMLISAYDAYLLGQKLQSGESIGENENGLSFLNAIFKD
jgi:hypothetical protein